MNTAEENKKIRIAAFVSHPIHYVIGFFREIVKNPKINLMIYFGSDFTIRSGLDTTFGKIVRWYTPDILDGLKYKILRNYSLYSSIGSFLSMINPGIFTELRRNKYDAIFINGWNYFSNWLAIVSAALTGTPIILRGESPLSQDSGKGRLKLLLKRIILGTMFKLVSAFLYIGEENKKFYLHYGVPADKLFFAPYAVNNDEFMKKSKELAEDKAGLRRKLLLPESIPLILFLGKLIDKKRPRDLLLAFEKLQERKIEAGLLFVGDGPLRNELEDYVEKKEIKNVYFVGFKPQEEVPGYYAAADMFVLPSESGETWGLVVNEAMCFSLPILVSSIVGCGSDLVKNGENGFIFKAGDVDELKNKLGILISDSKLREKFGRRSNEIVSGYSYSKDVEGILKSISSI